MQITNLEKFISEQTCEWVFPRREQLNNGTAQWQMLNRNNYIEINTFVSF